MGLIGMVSTPVRPAIFKIDLLAPKLSGALSQLRLSQLSRSTREDRKLPLFFEHERVTREVSGRYKRQAALRADLQAEKILRPSHMLGFALIIR
jgi:hypothetical protein